MPVGIRPGILSKMTSGVYLRPLWLMVEICKGPSAFGDSRGMALGRGNAKLRVFSRLPETDRTKTGIRSQEKI